MPARVLLIEDNPANLELMSYLLQAFGYDPVLATDGAAGLHAARSQPFDLIICDVQLPVVDGLEVARQLKADPGLRRVPLVAVTALAMVGDRDRLLDAGFDSYIAKPIDPETFVSQLQEFIPPSGDAVRASGASAVPTRPSCSRSRHSLLVVDNLAVHLDLARSIFEPHGFEVVTADRIADALALLQERSFDLILSDVCMPPGNGYDFIQIVKADSRLGTIPFVFLTSTMLEVKDRARGLALGAAGYLVRPIEPSVLLAEIEALLLSRTGVRNGEDSHR